MVRNSPQGSDCSEVEAGADPIVSELLDAFHERFEPASDPDDPPITIARAPGRVNLMGDHTDYNAGFVLPATIDRAVHVVLRPRRDQQVRLHSLNFDEVAAYPLLNPAVASLPGWAQYIAGVAEEMRLRAGTDTGFEGIVSGTVPLGAGLSSSAALEVAAAVALDDLLALGLDPVETARLCQKVEHKYVGVHCGIMDQMAARVGRAGHALSLDCRSLAHEHVPLPMADTCIVIADSRVSRQLASSKYNERRAECEEAVAHFQQFTPDVASLRDVTSVLFEQHGAGLAEPLRKRCRHVLSENNRVTRGTACLRRGAVEAFGQLMNASHESLRADYEVSAPELDVLVDAAQCVDGVYGARMTGAGFGGCIVCLTQQDAVPRLHRQLEHRYAEQFGREPTLYTVKSNLEAAVLHHD